jgi:hypothetical protein
MFSVAQDKAPRNAAVALKLIIVSYVIALGAQTRGFIIAHHVLKVTGYQGGKAVRPFVILLIVSAVFYAIVPVVIVKLNDRSSFARGAFAVLVMLSMTIKSVHYVFGDAPIVWMGLLLDVAILAMQLWAVGLLYSEQCKDWFE